MLPRQRRGRGDGRGGGGQHPASRRHDGGARPICPLPEDTASVLKTLGAPENMGLLLNKFGPFWRSGPPGSYQWSLSQEEQHKRLNMFVRDFAKSTGAGEEIVKSLQARQNLRIAHYRNQFSLSVEDFTAEVAWRMVVGLGTATVLEGSGMTLHWIYGFPYIPASAQKGLVSHYTLSEKGMKRGDAKFIGLFGDQEHRGKLIFFDAFPLEWPALEIDIINAHYQEYYQGSSPPADWLSPNPVYFLTVRAGTPFRFCLVAKENGLLTQAKSWLIQSLQDYGIGAKTRAGYGELQEVSATQRNDEETRTTTAKAATNITATLEAAIANWTTREMSGLEQLVETIAKVSQADHRRKLARQLQQKLKKARKWGRNFQKSPWHQVLENLLEGDDQR